MDLKKFLIGVLAAFSLSLSGCASMSSAWDWFFEDDEEEQVAKVDEEEMMEEEVIVEDEEFVGEEMDGEEMMDEEFDEEDDYGDQPMQGRRGRDAEQPRGAPMPQSMPVYFDYKSTTVEAGGLNILQLHAQYLRNNPQAGVILVGHTDSVAPSEYNKRLSMQRARSVAEMLVQMGVPEARIRTVARGEDSPAASGDDQRAHALNRRVEITYQ